MGKTEKVDLGIYDGKEKESTAVNVLISSINFRKT
jgi:hypothetical protein